MTPTIARPLIALATLAPLVLAIAGCSRGTALPANAASGAESSANVQLLTDIPIPAGATLDTDRSLILSDRDRWTGRVVMTLGNAANDVTAFYQSQMPGFGWQPVMSVTAETSIMTYLRGDRAATIQVERRSVSGTLVQITVAPRQNEGGNETAAAMAPRSAPAERIRSEPLPPPSRR